MKKQTIFGAGGAPVRATTMPSEAALRKRIPLASGVLDYFPDALLAVAQVSQAGNDQHNPGMSLRWTRSKSSDEADTLLRHFVERGTLDTDGLRHSAKMVWRALAILQKEVEVIVKPTRRKQGREKTKATCYPPRKDPASVEGIREILNPVKYGCE